jgi:hypothetical protein
MRARTLAETGELGSYGRAPVRSRR